MKNLLLVILFFFNYTCHLLAQDKHVDYYDNGKVYSEGALVDSIALGDWIFYYKNGKPLAKGTFKSGEKIGVWTFYYDNGKIESIGSFAKGKRKGDFKFYYPSGKIMSEGTINENLQTGLWKYYHEHGQLGIEGLFEHGYQLGVWKSYYGHGEVESISIYKNGQLKEHKEFYSDGTLKSLNQYYVSESKPNFEPKVLVDLILDSRQVLLETFYKKENVLDGKSETYYPDGTLHHQKLYNKGKEEGTWKYFEEGGGLMILENFKDGMLIEKRTYYESGKQEEFKQYKDGKLDGLCISYYNNKQNSIKAEDFFVNGERDSIQRFFDDNGDLQTLTEYKIGDFIKQEEYYSNGKLALVVESLSNEGRNLLKKFREDGSLESETLREETIIRYVKTYDKNGQLLKTDILSHDSLPPPPPPFLIEEEEEEERD